MDKSGVAGLAGARAPTWGLQLLDAGIATALAALLYAAANDGTFMFFNYHLHLAVAFLAERVHVAAPPSWLTEFAWVDGRAYVYFDAFPALFLLPWAAVRGLEVNIAPICVGIGAFNVGATRLLLARLGVSRGIANGTTALLGAGTVHFWAAEYGNTWLLAQLLAVSLLTMAWMEAAGEANPFLLGLLAALAATSRTPAALGAPCFLLLALRQRPRVGTVFEFGLGGALVAVVVGIYNAARFGSPFDNGYLYANQALLAPPHGSFSWHYLGQNLYHYFLRGPVWGADFPWVGFDDHGLALTLTTPAVVLLLGRGFSRGAPDAAFRGRVALAGTALIFGLYLIYFWDGWRQFGSRYTLDFTPFMLVALALREDGRVRHRLFVALVAASIAINLYGVWWLRFGQPG